jgi:RNA polymerase sigma-70 factor (ECF subfamily)
MPVVQPNRLNDLTQDAAAPDALDDARIVQRILSGDKSLFELIMRRYNQRLYRVVRGILGRDAEVEDVLQDAYINAYTHLHQFRGEASFSTWLTRIAVHGALRRRGGSRTMINSLDEADVVPDREDNNSSPQGAMERAELRTVLTEAVDRLPASLRAVVMLRDIEGMDTRNTASALDLSEENVRVRLHRARETLRHDLDRRLGDEIRALYPFGAERCDRVVAAVMRHISQ